MPNVCPLCKIRVSDWMMASGKTYIIDGEVYHKTCVIDHRLKTGKDLEPKKKPELPRDWSEGKYET